MVSNKYKKAGYKITVKPCKASPPLFVWPPKQIIVHYQLQALQHAPPVHHDAYYKLDQLAPAPNLLYAFYTDHPGPGPVVEIYAYSETKLITVECSWIDPLSDISFEVYDRAFHAGKTAFYDFEDWDEIDSPPITARVSFSL